VYLVLANLFVNVPRPRGGEVTLSVFESNATCYYRYLSYHSKVEAIPLSALPKDTTRELVGLSSHYPFLMLNVKPSFKVFWSDSTRKPKSTGYEADALATRPRVRLSTDFIFLSCLWPDGEL